MTASASETTTQTQVNRRLWAGDRVRRYAHRVLRPVEIVLLIRYRDQLGGRVLEIGCGAGRVLGYLVALGGEVHGIDVSRAMVAHCAQHYPQATVSEGDMQELTTLVTPPFDAILAPDNVLDILEPAARGRILRDIGSLLGGGGVLIFSAHNLASRTTPAPVPGLRRARIDHLAEVSLVSLMRGVTRLPVRMANRRRLSAAEHHASDYAILNDSEGDYGALHYYVTREQQERQLALAGLDLIECLDADGHTVRDGSAPSSPWLHYVAQVRPVG